MNKLSISVVVSNWRRQRFIPGILKQFSLQSYPKDKYEVIIVDDDSPNKKEVYSIVENMVHTYDDIKIRFFETHKNVTLNPAMRYNVGAKYSSNEIILLNESDVLQQGEFLQQVNENHLDDKSLFLGAEVIHVFHDGYRAPEKFRGPCDLGGSIRRKHFFAVRGFDERAKGWVGIEADFARRLSEIGVHYRKDPNMTILHQSVELIGLKERKFYDGKSAKLARSYYDFPPYIGIMPNSDSWGTVDTLEEIKF